MGNARLVVRPVTSATQNDLRRFSEEHGKFGYCSCMRWRMPSSEYRHSGTERRADELSRLVAGNAAVGLLAYRDERPVGWCAVAPRTELSALERYRALPRVDDVEVWAVVCFFVDRGVRHEGLTWALLRGAVRYARAQGAAAIEGYPVPPEAKLYTYMGSPRTFARAGFEDVTPPGQVRKVMRVTFSR